MSNVGVFSYTNSVTYVADNILKSFKDIIRLSGLDPSNLVSGWESNLLALTTWLESEDLEHVTLEIYDPVTDNLIFRWDLDIEYRWSSDDGAFWTDTDQLRYSILKAGVAPNNAKYELSMKTKPGRPDVSGWGKGKYRSTDGMVKQSIGSTVQHNGLAANAGYWRKT